MGRAWPWRRPSSREFKVTVFVFAVDFVVAELVVAADVVGSKPRVGL